MDYAFWFSLLVMLASFAVLGDVAFGWRRLRRLRDVAPILPANPPLVSLVVAARDEARAIEPAVRSMLALDYPALEVIVIDDRSTDATGQILDRLRAEFPALNVVHITELPAGWLGKTHALHRGSEAARGEYLLFTDADVVYERTAIRRAIALCDRERLDHLALVPDVPARSRLMQLNMMAGFVGLLALYRPWRADRKGRAGLGIGAFNLVRAAPYRTAGGHRALAMEVVDDVQLGHLMGEGGYRTELAIGHDLVSVEIYANVLESLRGVQKNAFAFLDYSVLILVAATAGTFALSVWPWLGLVVTDGVTRWMNVAAAGSHIVLYVHLAPQFKSSRWCVAYLPQVGIGTILILWQVAIRTWLQGGVVWRGTFYPLAELKARRRK